MLVHILIFLNKKIKVKQQRSMSEFYSFVNDVRNFFAALDMFSDDFMEGPRDQGVLEDREDL